MQVAGGQAMKKKMKTYSLHLLFAFITCQSFFFFNIYGQNNIAQYILFIFIPVCSLQDNVIKNIIVTL